MNLTYWCLVFIMIYLLRRFNMKKYIVYTLMFLLSVLCLFIIIFTCLVVYGGSSAEAFSVKQNQEYIKPHFTKFHFYKHLLPRSCRIPGRDVWLVFIYELKHPDGYDVRIAWSPIAHRNFKFPILID